MNKNMKIAIVNMLTALKMCSKKENAVLIIEQVGKDSYKQKRIKSKL